MLGAGPSNGALAIPHQFLWAVVAFAYILVVPSVAAVAWIAGEIGSPVPLLVTGATLASLVVFAVACGIALWLSARWAQSGGPSHLRPGTVPGAGEPRFWLEMTVIAGLCMFAAEASFAGRVLGGLIMDVVAAGVPPWLENVVDAALLALLLLFPMWASWRALQWSQARARILGRKSGGGRPGPEEWLAEQAKRLPPLLHFVVAWAMLVLVVEWCAATAGPVVWWELWTAGVVVGVICMVCVITGWWVRQR